ncbi:uncharacterized protein LOC113272947 [Papaver somniferum]|uniref:uncharacterized protein LOC113272947 n=1 Tax=Papaver somniferum TaxID=3469 RepID=UPI000E6FC18D|nr:uncharacterized protein LOC113272947 [Papaver somniferum]
MELLAKAAWRLCNNSHQMCAQALKGRYFPDTPVLHAKKKKNSTWAWQSIYSVMHFIRTHSFWVLGNGKNILTWKDNWIQEKESPPITIAYFEVAVNYHTVSDLIDADTRSLKHNIIYQLFSERCTPNIIHENTIYLHRQNNMEANKKWEF